MYVAYWVDFRHFCTCLGGRLERISPAEKCPHRIVLPCHELIAPKTSGPCPKIVLQVHAGNAGDNRRGVDHYTSGVVGHARAVLGQL